MRFLSPVLLALVLSFVLAARSNETVTLDTASDGCLSKSPGPPEHVQARAKDSRLLVSWDPPADRSCVSTFIVNVFDPELKSVIPVQTTSTDAMGTTVEGLDNGKDYRVAVQAYNDAFKAGGQAEVRAAPTAACNKNLVPGEPLNLRVQPGERMAQVCWDGVTNDACVDNYRVSAVKADQARMRSSSDGQLSKGACVNVTSLESGVAYKFTVTPTSIGAGVGKPGSTTATIGSSNPSSSLAGWKCKPIKGCRPGSASFCALSGCEAIWRLGGCKGPLMFDVDHRQRQVTQWCSESCNCDLSMANVFTPFSWGYQALNTLFGGQPGASQAPSLTSQIASTLADTNPRLSGAIQQLGSFTGAAPGPAAPAPQAAGDAPFAGGGAIATVLEKAVESGRIGELQGKVAGAVSGAVASTVVSGAVNGASNAANALFQAGLNTFQASAGLPPGSTGNVAALLQQAAGSFSEQAGKVAGAVTSAVTSDLVSNTVNGMVQQGANRLTQAFSRGAPSGAR